MPCPRPFLAAGAGLYLDSAATGAVARRLLPPVYDGMRAVGAAVSRDGNVWVTYSKGPAVSQVGFGPESPKPDSCANAVVEWNLQGATPRPAVFTRTGDNVLLGQAVPSPNGQLLAYTEHPCNINGVGVYLRVTDMSSKRSWTIGQRLPGCHVLTTPAWSASGTQLVEGYAAANLPYNAGADFCTGPQTERLLRLGALAPQPGAAGQVTSPDGNCQVSSVAGLAGGGALLPRVLRPVDNEALDFAALLVVGADGSTSRPSGWAAARCRQLAGDASGGSVLVTGALYCKPSARATGQLSGLLRRPAAPGRRLRAAIRGHVGRDRLVAHPGPAAWRRPGTASAADR